MTYNLSVNVSVQMYKFAIRLWEQESTKTPIIKIVKLVQRKFETDFDEAYRATLAARENIKFISGEYK